LADTKISDLTEISTAATGDEFVVVDKSDTTSGAAGTNKKITLNSVTSSGDIVTLTGIQTLTNKTLTTPTITNPTLSGSSDTLTLPAGPDTLVGRATTDTLTNKTLTSPTLTTAVVATSLDMNGTELILDSDADTSITADSDDTIDIRIAANDDFQFTANSFKALSGSVIEAASGAEIRMPNNEAFTSRNAADNANLDLIAANASNQTIIGQNSVRATRFVPKNIRIELLNTDPLNTDWTDLDVSASTSSTTFMVIGMARIRDTAGADRTLFVRRNGGIAAQGRLTTVASTGASTADSWSGFQAAVDTSQIFEWSVDDADVDGVSFELTGFWEYVD